MVHSSSDTSESVGVKSYIHDVNWVDASVVHNRATPGRPKPGEPKDPYQRYLENFVSEN